VASLLLAALRPGGARGWLGPDRLAALADELNTTPADIGRLLNERPRLPSILGEPGPWLGRRVPFWDGEAIVWAKLFWRPEAASEDKGRGHGVLALTLTLPRTGKLVLRARLEEERLDAVMSTEDPLPRALAADVAEIFTETLRRLGLDGDLTLQAGPAPGNP